MAIEVMLVSDEEWNINQIRIVPMISWYWQHVICAVFPAVHHYFVISDVLSKKMTQQIQWNFYSDRSKDKKATSHHKLFIIPLINI